MSQVLTANLGHLLGLRGGEQGLEGGVASLTYEQYRYYLQTEVFSALPDQEE